MNRNNQTIAAIATASGTGAIGIVRLSGNDAISITDTIFKGKILSKQATHTIHFGSIVNGKNDLIDEVVVALYKAPKSFTGEETVEISGHGSPYVLQQILDACIASGAVLANPGEFTQRAFLNGKLDLAQAEAVADLIAAENKAAHDLALKQMRGGVSNEMAMLREQLINFTALIELELDFSDEDVAFADRSQLKELIQNLQSKIQNLIKSFEYGNAIKNGIPVAIIGKPNAGKSTLLNALLQEERAIVSEIAGTTRDAIEETFTLNGILFRFIDTAGIRDTEDLIEAIGVQRAKEKVLQAKVVLHLYENDYNLLDELQEALQDKIVFNLHSKTDIATANTDITKLQTLYPDYHHFGISGKTGNNIDYLQNRLATLFQNNIVDSSVVISNIRHKDALQQSLLALQAVGQGIGIGLSGDMLAVHLKEALYHLGSITGKIEVDKDILGAIFGRFCIGK